MKNLIYIIPLALMIISTGCERDLETEGSSRTTYFPTFTFEGEQFMTTTPGNYTEPGITATEDGVELEVTTAVSGKYTGMSDLSVMDEYAITYTAFNSDGFPGSSVRTVRAVSPNGDMINSIEGLYTASTVRNDGNTSSGIEVWISEVSAGVYVFSHAAGGYYSDGLGYGDGYRAGSGRVTANDISTNDFSAQLALFPTWGNTIDIQDMEVDAATKTITYTAVSDFASGRTWAVTLVQNP